MQRFGTFELIFTANQGFGTFEGFSEGFSDSEHLNCQALQFDTFLCFNNSFC